MTRSIARHKMLFSKLLDVSEVFWSLRCILKLKLLCTQWCLKKSKVQNIKQWCYCVFTKTAFLVKGSKKHPLTVDTDNQTFNWDNADRHSQTGNQKISTNKIRKKSWRTKALRNALRLCLHTVAYLTFIYTSFLLHAFWIIQTKSHGLLFKFNYC